MVHDAPKKKKKRRDGNTTVLFNFSTVERLQLQKLEKKEKKVSKLQKLQNIEHEINSAIQSNNKECRI